MDVIAWLMSLLRREQREYEVEPETECEVRRQIHEVLHKQEETANIEIGAKKQRNS